MTDYRQWRAEQMRDWRVRLWYVLLWPWYQVTRMRIRRRIRRERVAERLTRYVGER